MSRVGVKNVLPNVVIDYAHQEVHEGDMFRLVHFFQDVTNGEIKRYLIVTSNKEVHLQTVATVLGPCITRIFENPVVVTSGTEITPYNLNRCCTNLAETKFYYGTSLASTGTTLSTRLLIGQTGGGAGSTAIRTSIGETATQTEFIMDTASLYCFSIQNTSGSNSMFNAQFEFYEEG